MHAAALAFYRANLAALPPLSVVEFGSCDMNGSVRDVYTASSWLGIDVQDGPGVDVVADVATWRTDQRFEICVCAEVFEHTPDWRAILATAFDVTTPDGVFVASCATGLRPPHSAVDGGPLRPGEYYANVEPDEMWQALDAQDWAQIAVTKADGYFGGDDLYIRATK